MELNLNTGMRISKIRSPLAHFDAQVSWSTGSWRFPHDESAVRALRLEGACPREVFLSIKVELETAVLECVGRRPCFDVGVADDVDGVWQVVLDGHDSVVCAGWYGFGGHEEHRGR